MRQKSYFMASGTDSTTNLNRVATSISLFDADDNAAVVARIESITAETQPQWGTMSSGQMMAHCQVPLLIALGRFDEPPPPWWTFPLRPLIRRMMLSKKPFGRNMPTVKSMMIRLQPDFDIERRKLVDLVQEFRHGPPVLTLKPHPIMGTLSHQEWDWIQYKHLDHHLRQFGV